MGMMFAMSIPGLAVLLLVLAAGERLWKAIRRRKGHPVISATALDEFTTLFSGGKHIELEQRQITLMLGEDEESGAPPRGPVDLDSGTVRLIPKPATPE
ncbi:hypothetical protein ALI22I_31485 [Saccharothrix sp. ALI-22-I]|uniref:DUF6191 domain-containing protein n=1 Tax=Saccharothrix sp. ALI-22-I TaxID=1933778 RepID=UPI00097C7A19|nr:DUF6191 domain-containing protein [Saccharothrix sp. ALI-22-I]ONI84980.1 hypothetical protein ALI22I_31485 [Saccharothrix sp. ALI-22-I]